MNSLKPWKRDNDTYENNEKARKAYEALLIVTAREPEYDQFRNFYLNIKEIAKAKFKYDYQLEEVILLVRLFSDLLTADSKPSCRKLKIFCNRKFICHIMHVMRQSFLADRISRQ